MKKCSCCGGSNLRRVPNFFDVHLREFHDLFRLSKNISLYGEFNETIDINITTAICVDCAHIELFAHGLEDAIKRIDDRLSKLNAEAQSLQPILTKMGDNDVAVADKLESDEALFYDPEYAEEHPDEVLAYKALKAEYEEWQNAYNRMQEIEKEINTIKKHLPKKL